VPKVYALLVGIDLYRSPGLNLQGCVNDVVLAAQLLRKRIEPNDLAIETLCNEQATRAEIIRMFRKHLGAAGAGDIALFWFSGHGSTGTLPAEIWYAESSAMCQTTVCHDSRDGVPDLYDKELAVLVHDVVATGARMVTINDSCHSRSAVRGGPEGGLRTRVAPSSDTAPALPDLLPELVRAAEDPARPVPGMQERGHVALSACDEWEVAHEVLAADRMHGAFSAALGQALTGLGPDATYRQVLSDARCRVEGRFRRQKPTLEALGGLADEVFLGGALRPRTAQITLRYIRLRWEVDVGALHGLVVDTRLAVHFVQPLHEVRVVEVHTERSIVEPIDWMPDRDLQYEMVLVTVPLPSVAVSIRANPDVTARLTEAVRTAASGRPSPHVRTIPAADEPAARLLLRVLETDDDASIRVHSADQEPLAPPAGADTAGIAQVVRDLEHIACWMQVRNLSNPSSALEHAVAVDVLPPLPGGGRPPHDQEPLPPGNLQFDYTWTDAEWRPPAVFVRLRNTTDQRLFCVLLDLTDQHRMHADLFPGAYVAANWSVDVGGGRPITLSLPPERPLEPGASVTDWLVLLVAEAPFSSDPFSLPRLRDVPRSPARGARHGITGVLDRLGLLAVWRDAAPAPVTGPALDWAVTVLEVTTRVPGANRLSRGRRG
jgi:hypothetical protein